VSRGWGSGACPPWGRGDFRGTSQPPQCLRGGDAQGTAGSVTAVRGRATRHGRHKLTGEGFRLGAETSPREDRQARGRQRDRLPGELGQAPCLVGFKIWLGRALGNLVRSHSWPCSEHGCPRDLLRSLPT